MKKNLLLLFFGFMSFFSFAQTIDEGKKFLYYERWQSAEKTFSELVKQQPQNAEANFWLLRILLEQNKLQEAKQLQQNIAANASIQSHPLIKVIAGEILLHDNKLIQAKALFDQALKDTRQKDPQVLIAVVQAYLNTKQTEHQYVLDLLEKAEKRNKKNPEIFVLRGDVYRRMNDGGKAVQSYENALQKDASYVKAAYGIAKIYLTQNNTEMFLKHFNSAIEKDPLYAPALYEMYYYYYFRDVNKAKEYLDRYIANTDPSIDNNYMMTDLLYASSKHREALEMAKSILQKEGDAAQPRIYKLMAYTSEALGDSINALDYINRYFDKAADSTVVAKDFELKANVLVKFPGNENEAIANLQKAIELDTLEKNKIEYMSGIVSMYKKTNDKSNEAMWLGKLYQTKTDPSNIDLYNWGLAHYLAQEYQQADTVFSLYSEKYPDHVHGYYWRAKSNALIDTTMEAGLAIPYYKQVIEIAGEEKEKNKAILIQAYGYLGAYEANVKKEYDDALMNFEKILELDPGNADAVKFAGILKKRVEAEIEN